jgi:hypothetical protein
MVVALGTQTSKAADAILTGNVLKVGVNDSGSLIDSGFNVGITWDSTGTGTFGSLDFLKPGSPYEFYSAGYTGVTGDPVTGVGAYYNGSNAFNAITANTSSGGTLSTLTTGNLNGALALSQVLSYGANSGTIDFSVTLTNTSGDTLNNVVYARGLDPDQDVFGGGSYSTQNDIISNDLVIGTGLATSWTIGISTNSSYAHAPSIVSGWPYTDPNGLQTNFSGITSEYADDSINMAWNIGTLDSGDSATINFEYIIGPTVGDVTGVPDAASTLSLLVLGFAFTAIAGRSLKQRAVAITR